jgi:ADP-heptose:LPS heptosyltransferase
MKNVMIVKIGALGDLSFALPAAKAFKDAFPCQVTWIVGKTYHRFLEGHAYIDNLIVLDDKKLYSKNIFLRIYELLKLACKARKRYDIVVIAHRDPMYYPVFNVFTRGKGQTFQMVRDSSKDPANFVYTEPLKLHESLAIKKLIELAINYSLPVKQTISWDWDYSYIESAGIRLPKAYMVLHLGGGVNPKTEFQLKRWPHWEKLILRLLSDSKAKLVFVGSPAEAADYKVIEEKIKQLHPEKLNRCYNLMNNLSLRQLVDVIQQCDLFVGVDSGPLHIADSMDKPAIGLFGPTSSVSWGVISKKAVVMQQSIHCSPCYKDDGFFPECNNQHRCMTTLDVEPVFLKIMEMRPTAETPRLNVSPL